MTYEEIASLYRDVEIRHALTARLRLEELRANAPTPMDRAKAQIEVLDSSERPTRNEGPASFKDTEVAA